jgi:hypothetical protein
MMHRAKDAARASAPPIVVHGNKIDPLNAKGEHNERSLLCSLARSFRTLIRH